jgi:CSLREA domain-containing protein
MNANHKPPKPSPVRRVVSAVLAVGLILGPASGLWLTTRRVWASAITVNTTSDDLNSDGDCSLREAIRAANLDMAVDACPAGSGADTITLPAGNYVLALAGANENAALTGDLDITEDLTITGAGATSTGIDANSLDRVFHITGANTTQISGMTIQDGSAAWGGGIFIEGGVLTLTSSRIRNNMADNFGGGISVEFNGTLTLTNSRVENNTGLGGGGVDVTSGATALINNSTVSGNTATDPASGGGGIFNGGTMTIVNSTLSGNSALGSGGGTLSDGATSLFNIRR